MKLKEWQNSIECKVAQNEISTARLFTVMRDKQNELEKQLEQYKSLVKTVDADNLPNGEVLIKSYNDVYLGEISLNTDNNLTLTECDDTKLNINNSTHYIEQKDLIELIALGEKK